MGGSSVLIIGSGAREHAISLAYEKSLKVSKIIVAPGNDFIAFNRRKEVLVDKSCDLKDSRTIRDIVRKYSPDLVDIAQDDALAGDAGDSLREKGFRVFAPSRRAARVEWDKKWSREFMQRHNIAIPEFESFDSEEKAIEYVRKLYGGNPDKTVYIKAAGLCSGRGALKSGSLEEAIENIRKMRSFGSAGNHFLVEEGLCGEEFSCYAISDGYSYKMFKSAQDNKTAFDFDEGPQTGGMGAVSPAMVTFSIGQNIEDELISGVISGLAEEGLPYLGILYLGGILDGNRPLNIEYNARWGDPECQAVLLGVKNDYFDMVNSCLDGHLNDINLMQDSKTRVCVVGASRGYPGNYSSVRGKQIYGLDKAMGLEGVTIFGAGISVEEGRFYVNGGRIFNVVAEGETITEARQKAYSALAYVSIEGNNLHFRTDIGWRDVQRFNSKK